MRYFGPILILLISLPLYAKLPAAAQEIVDALPDKALTMELILTRGAKSAESFKQVQAEAALVPIRKWQSESLYTPRFVANATHLDNRNEPASPFSTDKNIATAYTLGVSKYFSTGSTFELSLSQSDVLLSFAPASSIADLDYYDSGLSLTFKQKLLKDPFGYSSRRLLKSGLKLSEAQENRAEVALETWVSDISNLFYAAWLSKQALLTADENVERRNQLLKTTRLKAKRGTSEKPDLLQVESVQLFALNQRDRAAQDLNNHWRNLILSLKLPAEWIQVDPRLVPITLDNPIDRAKSQCEAFRKKGVPKDENANVRMNQALHESAKLAAEARKKEIMPDLEFEAKAITNGVEDTASDSLSEGLGTDNPQWQVGLTLTVPLSFDAEKASYLEQYANQIRSESNFNSARDDLRIAWMNDCSNLERLIKGTEQARNAFKKQQTRERLESKRFRLGRIPVFNYIQAGDDAADAENFYNQQQVLLRQASWQVLRNASEISNIMKEMEKTYAKYN